MRAIQSVCNNALIWAGPGAHMPRFIFSEPELDALTEYLDGLK